MLDVDIQVTGPVFTGAADGIIDDYMKEAKQEIAQEGENLIGIWLDLVLQNPTGFYESQIVTSFVSEDPVLDDSGVVYGPWLEGVGSRNATTRFKGYHTFRVVAQDLQDAAPRIAEEVLQKYLGRLNA